MQCMMCIKIHKNVCERRDGPQGLVSHKNKKLLSMNVCIFIRRFQIAEGKFANILKTSANHYRVHRQQCQHITVTCIRKMYTYEHKH